MSGPITPVRVAALPAAVFPRKRSAQGTRIGLVACELLCLVALSAIIMPLTSQLRWPDPGRLLNGWPDLRDAQAACQRFARGADSLRAHPTTTPARDAGSWSWVRLDDGRFRILGYIDGRTASGTLRRTRYQCDLAPLTSTGRWRVDNLVVRGERPT